MPEKVKNDIVKFKDFHMQIMQSFMIIADFEAYTNELNQIKPYSFRWLLIVPLMKIKMS